MRGEYGSLGCWPRHVNGTTSACAENTPRVGGGVPPYRNYLRVRGEYEWCGHPCVSPYGTTSACAENTARKIAPDILSGNYLRVRGEYCYQTKHLGFSQELPPRARRIHIIDRLARSIGGTTSACAENTPQRFHELFGLRNYLRVRGEYVGKERIHEVILELPPRARRIHGKSLSVRMGIGTTSACAENTSINSRLTSVKRNYLRVRGEYHDPNHHRSGVWELPPRARRILIIVGE